MDLRAVVANTLKSDADVTAAADLAGAGAVLAASQFDLVILDLMLPDGSGDRLVEELSQRHPDLPVLIFSAYDPSPSLARQVAGVLAKSRTSNAELLQTIRKAAGRRPRSGTL